MRPALTTAELPRWQAPRRILGFVPLGLEPHMSEGDLNHCLRDGAINRLPAWRQAVNARADRWIRRTTTGCVALLAMIAGTVSYLHMHLLVELHGQPGWVAALTPLSVDG